MYEDHDLDADDRVHDTQPLPQVEMTKSLEYMLRAILYAYGVDLTVDGSCESISHTLGCPITMDMLGLALSDGVALCKLATCVEHVSRTKTRCKPVSPIPSTIRGWTLNPKNRSQRLNNIRIALQVLRNDRCVQCRGHASHWALAHPDYLECGDAEATRNLLCIVYGALPVAPEKEPPARGREDTRMRARTHTASEHSSARDSGREGEWRARNDSAEAKDVTGKPPDMRHRSSSVPCSRYDQTHTMMQEQSPSRSVLPRSTRLPQRGAAAVAPGIPAVVDVAHDDVAHARECEEEDTVIYDVPSDHGNAAARKEREGQRGGCVAGCGGWEEVEWLLEADRAQPAFGGQCTLPSHTATPYAELADGGLAGRGRFSVQLQLHTCRWLVTLNLPDATPALSRHEFANLSQAAHSASLLDDPLKNGCMLLHVAQVLRAQKPCAPPWCDARGRPTCVTAVRRNVETALQLVRPLLQSAHEHCGHEALQGASTVPLLDVEALVAGDDVAIWTLLHRLRLASRHMHSLADPTSRAASALAGARPGKLGQRRVLPYSADQTELLEAAVVMWLSSVAQHVPALKAVLPAPGDESLYFPEVSLVGGAPRLLGLVLAEMYDSGGILLASVASFATGMPVHVMRSVGSLWICLWICVGNMLIWVS